MSPLQLYHTGQDVDCELSNESEDEDDQLSVGQNRTALLAHMATEAVSVSNLRFISVPILNLILML